ncbi:hypothetical protein AB1Y20_000402 [Prymnesium parvum]|uniref:LIM zinc-binding domain-containing protein n=1 Tax=Prymnesium parvum TaxID=97485 RepID=A0AB34K586_PRYPA
MSSTPPPSHGGGRGSDRELEEQLIAALSSARTNPAGLAERIEARAAHFQGQDYYPPHLGGKVCLPTKEGRSAVMEAVSFLRALRSALPPLKLPEGPAAAAALQLSAEDHLVDRAALGRVGHLGSDGSHAAERQSRYGRWSGKCGECLWFGRPGGTAAAIVEDLVIDDGVASRGHRHCVFDASYAVAAACVGAHPTFGAMAVIEFAASFEAEADAVAARRERGPPQPAFDAGAAGDMTQWSSTLGECAGCKQAIKGGAVVEVGLGKFHKLCFTCASCEATLVGIPYVTEARAPYCKACHVHLFAPLCSGCKTKIAGGGVTVGGVPFHRECKPAASRSGGGLAPACPAPKTAVARAPKSSPAGKTPAKAESGVARSAHSSRSKSPKKKAAVPGCGGSKNGSSSHEPAGQSMDCAYRGMQSLALDYGSLE